MRERLYLNIVLIELKDGQTHV